MKEFSFRTYAQQTFNLIYIAFYGYLVTCKSYSSIQRFKDEKEHNTKSTTLLVTLYFTNANMNIVSPRSNANNENNSIILLGKFFIDMKAKI